MKKILLLGAMILSVHCAHGERLQKIQITGNKRIESVTITSLLGVQVGDQLTTDSADTALQNLYNTGYFADVKVKTSQGTLEINLEENPTIYEISYEGNSKLSTEQIESELKLQPRRILSKIDIQNAQQRLLEIYRRMGRFNAKVDPKIIELDNNRVSLVFEIEEGEATHIQNIFFVGNNKFSTSRLEEVMVSKRYRFWRFFANDDVFDPDRFMADQQALRQFYMYHGYPDFRIVNALAELTPDRTEYYLTFTIEEGDLYTFSQPKIMSAVRDISVDDLKLHITFSEGQTYSAREVEQSVTEMTNALGAKGYAFVAVEPTILRNKDNKTAQITFEIKEGPRVQISRIDVKGNTHTHSNVIMREISLQEGDAYNISKIRDSERNIRDLGYFKEATIESGPGGNMDQAKLKIQVEEQRTGEIKLNGGFITTDGFTIGFGASERNFMGKGQIVHADLAISKKYQDINVGITEPYLFNRPLMGNIDLYSTRSARVESYVTKSTGLNIGMGYHITRNLMQRFTYSLHQDSVSKVADDVSDYLKADPTKSLISSLNHHLTYDKRDNTQDPKRGYIVSLSNTYVGLGGNVRHVRNDFTGTIFYTPIEDLTMLCRLGAGRIDAIGSKRIRIVDAINLGGDTLRGFEHAGVGPRDIRGRKDVLGGLKYWRGTIEAQFPVGLPIDFGVKGALFTDFGNVWQAPVTDTAHVLDPKKVRMSCGASIIWKSPFGPLRIDYAIPIMKTPHDEIQRINIGYALPL